MMKSKLLDLTGKVGIVTGSSRGLGKTIAIGLAECGAKVVTCSRNVTEAEATAKEIRDQSNEAFAMRVDTSVRADCQILIDETIRRYGKLDIMVCNAGISTYTAVEDVEEEEWNNIMDINLKGYFNCAQLAARQMMKQGTGGSIVMNSSNNSLVGYPGLFTYSVSKGGVDQMVRSMALEWGNRGIRVNAINPGWMETSMSGGKRDPEMEREIKKLTPMGRRGFARELIGPVVFLASEASSFVTGISLVVDGGWCTL
jgi:NAD(P)-dependent dehydrogenase (short-subunit alcohol dehydrogenase family)